MNKCRPVFHDGRWKQHRAPLNAHFNYCVDCGEHVPMTKENWTGLTVAERLLPRRFKHREVNLGISE